MCKKTVNKSKFLVMMLAISLIISMIPSMAFAEDTLSHVNDSATGLTISVSEGIEKLNIVADTSHGTNYAITGTVAGYFPQNFSLMFNNGTGVSVTCPDEQVHFEILEPVSAGYGCVSMGAGDCVLTVTKAGMGSCTIYCPAPVGNDVGGNGLMAYCPGAGQFANEGITKGGWGDGFISGNSGEVKAMVNVDTRAGISLGAFGGYAVFDFGVPAKDANGNVVSGIYNDPNNKYGVDFIIYGNAFQNWAEPGCVQVSVDGRNWYDIAGSLHYRRPVYSNGTNGEVISPGAVWNYRVRYKNPVWIDDAPFLPPQNYGGTAGHSPQYEYWSTIRPGEQELTGTGEVTYNLWHQHSWFPLNRNYFTDRTTANTPINLRGHELANLPFASTFGVEYTPAALTNNAYPYVFSKLTLKGVKLEPVPDAPENDNFLFGYADCHGNGTISGSQVNPYASGRTAGGDPIDISWAVYPYGTNIDGVDMSGRPVSLQAIRYVRVYTGVQHVDLSFGETSTEISSVYRATDTGSGAHSNPVRIICRNAINGKKFNITCQQHMGVEEKNLPPGEYMFRHSGTGIDYAFVNGERKTTWTNFTIASGEVKTYQVIIQGGTNSPYIVLIKFIGE